MLIVTPYYKGFHLILGTDPKKKIWFKTKKEAEELAKLAKTHGIVPKIQRVR